MARIILHIDLNSFFASCEIAKDPNLKDKAVVVAGKNKRGIILTASYEARKYGIKAAMPTFMAERLCKNLIIKTPNMELYQNYSKLFFDELTHYCDKYEAASIDEAYLDVTEISKKYKNAIELAQTLQKTLLDKYNLPTSIGIAPNRFMAKMASNMKKPLGITILRKRDIPQMLWTLPIEEVHGIGNKTIPKLKNIGINKIGDLNNKEKTIKLKQILGKGYTHILDEINGRGSDVVITRDYDDSDQIGNSRTFEKDTDDINIIKDKIADIVRMVHVRMKNRHVVACSFAIVYKYNRFEQFNRSISIEEYTNDYDILLDLANNLFDKNWNGDSIRLIGFSANNIKPEALVYKQLNIFNYDQETKTEKEITIENIKKKYGESIIFRASDKRFHKK